MQQISILEQKTKNENLHSKSPLRGSVQQPGLFIIIISYISNSMSNKGLAKLYGKHHLYFEERENPGKTSESRGKKAKE